MTYGIIPTNQGKALLANAIANQTTLEISHAAVGDSLYTPTESQTTLQHEVYRCTLNNHYTDPSHANTAIFEMSIPADIGGFTVREMGLFTPDGTLVFVGDMPDTVKSIASEGAVRDMRIVMYVAVEGADKITVALNPSIVWASRQWVGDNFVLISTFNNHVNQNQQAHEQLQNQITVVDARLSALIGGEVPTDTDTIKEIADVLIANASTDAKQVSVAGSQPFTNAEKKQGRDNINAVAHGDYGIGADLSITRQFTGHVDNIKDVGDFYASDSNGNGCGYGLLFVRRESVNFIYQQLHRSDNTLWFRYGRFDNDAGWMPWRQMLYFGADATLNSLVTNGIQAGNINANNLTTQYDVAIHRNLAVDGSFWLSGNAYINGVGSINCTLEYQANDIANKWYVENKKNEMLSHVDTQVSNLDNRLAVVEYPFKNTPVLTAYLHFFDGGATTVLSQQNRFIPSKGTYFPLSVSNFYQSNDDDYLYIEFADNTGVAALGETLYPKATRITKLFAKVSHIAYTGVEMSGSIVPRWDKNTGNLVIQFTGNLTNLAECVVRIDLYEI